MTWREKVDRPPTWPMIALEFGLGIMMLAFAILEVTRYWDLVEKHDDGLLVVGFAAVGGLALGISLEMARRRIATGQPR